MCDKYIEFLFAAKPTCFLFQYSWAHTWVYSETSNQIRTFGKKWLVQKFKIFWFSLPWNDEALHRSGLVLISCWSIFSPKSCWMGSGAAKLLCDWEPFVQHIICSFLIKSSFCFESVSESCRKRIFKTQNYIYSWWIFARIAIWVFYSKQRSEKERWRGVRITKHCWGICFSPRGIRVFSGIWLLKIMSCHWLSGTLLDSTRWEFFIVSSKY